jgi:hypothetical protein
MEDEDEKHCAGEDEKEDSAGVEEGNTAEVVAGAAAETTMDGAEVGSFMRADSESMGVAVFSTTQAG